MDVPVGGNLVTTTCSRCKNVVDVTDLEPGDGIECPYCQHEFKITLQFGGFLLERLLGTGGMGAVYLARDLTLNRVVAVKVLKRELASDGKFIATFLREAEITASLNHPNIVQVYAFGQHEGIYYLVVENIPGGSLDDKLTGGHRITELEGIEIGLAVARGLECALERGLIHRDIKPGNILLTGDGTAKVVDFGLSISFDSTDHLEDQIWGTPDYISPEKLERKPEDFRSDLYSLGATLFHALAGRPPYTGNSPTEIAMKHLNGNSVSLKAFTPDVSDQTTYAIGKAMARHPEDRYESYAGFIEQLEDAKRRLTDPHYRAASKRDTAILETREGARYQYMFVVSIVVALVIVVGLILWKGSSLFQKKVARTAAEAEDLSEIIPAAHNAATPAPLPAPPRTTTPGAASPAPPVIAPAAPSVSTPGTIALTVDGGSGSGTYLPGTTVTITANRPAKGYHFTGWTGATGSLGNPATATTTLTMPAQATTVTAIFAANPLIGTSIVSVQFPQYHQNKVTTLMSGKNYAGGLLPVQNWNVAVADSGTSPTSNDKLLNHNGSPLGSSVLIDSAGDPTSIGFTYSGYTRNDRADARSFPDPAWYQTGAAADASIASGANFNETGDPETLNISGLDPAQSYDLIIYVTSASSSNDGSATASVNSARTTFYLTTAKNLASWTQATSTKADSPSTANCVRFRHLSGFRTQTVTLTGAFAGIAGFQLILPPSKNPPATPP